MSSKAETRNISRASERVSVALLESANTTDALRGAISRGAAESGVPFSRVESSRELVEDPARARGAFVIFIAPDVERRAVQAREVYRAYPSCEIVFLSATSGQQRLKQELGPVPMIGVNWTVIDPVASDLPRVVREMVRALQQRVQFRTTLDRFNVQITSRPIDAGERRRLVISDRFLASILESAGEAILSVDLSFKLLTLNRTATELFEVQPADAIGKRVSALAGGGWSETCDAMLDELVATGESQSGTCAAITRSGREVELALTIAYIHDEAGKPAAVSMLLRDMTELRQSEEALRRSEKLAAVGRLAASISHEINNPLEAVTNLLYILEHTTGMDEQSLEYIRTAQRELTRVTHIASQTLSFFREPTRPVEVSPARLFDEGIEVFASKLLNKRVSVVRRYRSEKCVTGFPGELRQVLSNLLLNAIEAVDVDGTVALSVTESSSSDGVRGLAISVCDDGVGIPPDQLVTVFEAFFTTKKESGTGLGLWIVKSIVDKLGGSIRVRSSTHGPVRGTCFRLFVPFESEER